MAETKVISAMEKRSLQKRVNYIMVECVQNITRHQAKPGGSVLSIFTVGWEKDDIFIMTGNPIHTSEKDALIAKIEAINAMDENALKQHYMSVLGDGKHNSKGGANLGLIDIARKSKGNLQYQFKALDEELSYFTLKVNVAKD